MTNQLLLSIEAKHIIELALAEDRVWDDVTGCALVPAGLTGQTVLQAKATGVVAGLAVFHDTFLLVDPNLSVNLKIGDGDAVKPGDIAAVVVGNMRNILAAERVALNFVCHLSGVATLTARYVDAVKGNNAVITDTRKTMPGLRCLEKEAVKAGGGINHRFNLADGAMIKDNHLAVLRSRGTSLGEVVRQAKESLPPSIMMQVEVTNLAEAEEAVAAGADMLLLDNLTPDEVREIVLRFGRLTTLEASGGITLENVSRYAKAGVTRISIGALTHSARALDFSLEMTPC